MLYVTWPSVRSDLSVICQIIVRVRCAKNLIALLDSTIQHLYVGGLVEVFPSRSAESLDQSFPRRDPVEKLEQQDPENHFFVIGFSLWVVDHFLNQELAHPVAGAEDVCELVL